MSKAVKEKFNSNSNYLFIHSYLKVYLSWSPVVTRRLHGVLALSKFELRMFLVCLGGQISPLLS